MSTAQFARMSPQEAERFMAGAKVQPARTRLAQLVAGRMVVDIGCGKGEEVELYDPKRYLGVDCSAELIRIAEERHPAHRFLVADALDLVGPFDCGIIKSVLEHLPMEEAVAVYERARWITNVLYVAWHTEPKDRPRPGRYFGELAEPMQQNIHDRSLFAGVIAREVCGAHVIWTVTK